LVNPIKKEEFLKTVKVESIWGVGEKYAQYFQKRNLNTAFNLLQSDENRIREKLGVVGQRIVLELRGTVCYPLNENPESKKEICTSRSFGNPIESYDELEQATSTYVAKVAKKLRAEKSLAQSLLIFIMTNKFATGPQYVNYKIVKLPVASNQTSELIHYARIALKALFRDGYKYKKSGIIVSELVPETGVQKALWEKQDRDKKQKLINVIDKINQKAGIDKVKFAIQGDEENWKMRQHNLSPRYTTRWKDILVVNVDKWVDPKV
jgi:DNA polymerase V